MAGVRISAIVAIDEKRGMGKDGGIPWHIPGEQKRFKDITTPHPMIMGRKTFASIGRVLPGRPHIIVTRNAEYKVEGATIVESVKKALEVAKELEEERLENVRANNSSVIHAKAGIQEAGSPIKSGMTTNQDPSILPKREGEPEVFFIGGGEIFKEAFGFLDRLYLTIIEKDFHCDTFFPEYRQFTKVIENEEHTFEDISYTYLTLQK